jgi:glucose/arabinose dehydrogenase
MRRILYFACFTLFFLSSCAPSNTSHSAGAQATEQPTTTLLRPSSSIPNIELPAGFQITVYARGLNSPRFMTIGPNGTLFVSDDNNGTIYHVWYQQ